MVAPFLEVFKFAGVQGKGDRALRKDKEDIRRTGAMSHTSLVRLTFIIAPNFPSDRSRSVRVNRTV